MVLAVLEYRASKKMPLSGAAFVQTKQNVLVNSFLKYPQSSKINQIKIKIKLTTFCIF